MSRYYLDDADIQTNRDLFERYAAEAQRLSTRGCRSPRTPTSSRCSHAFNVLDSRGAISTTERAKAFGTMRRLAREVSRLWVERREELGYPLLVDELPPMEGRAVMPPFRGVESPSESYAAELASLAPDVTRRLALEIGVEELPPHVVPEAIEQVRRGLTEKLGATRLPHGSVVVHGTPRRIVALVDGRRARTSRMPRRCARGPRSPPRSGRTVRRRRRPRGSLGGRRSTCPSSLRAEFDGVEHVAVRVHESGRGVFEVLGSIIADVVAGLRADKNMRWSDPELAYSRPIRWIVALWGDTVVPVSVSGLRSGRTTYGERTEAGPLIEVENADVLLPRLAERDFIVDPAERRDSVVAQAHSLAASVGGGVDVEGEAALVDEITNLVEAPHGILGSFEERYLELPEQILTTVMRKHQRYLPVRSAEGGLVPYFVTMANGDCDDDLVRAGNENVLRARYEDAAFFYAADLKVPVADLRAGIAKLTFEERVGSMADRADRIRDVAAALAEHGRSTRRRAETLSRASELAKFDLASQMVVELSSLAGYMAREYALKAGETPEAVAQALYEMEQPRTAGGALPESRPGALLALADRFDLLMAMFALGAKPTGSSDPFALRRAALGVIGVLRSQPTLSAISVEQGLRAAADQLRQQGLEVSAESIADALEFVTGRFGQQLREEGVPSTLAAAVQPLAGSPGKAEAVLRDIETVRGRDGFPKLVEATQRITRIVPEGSPAAYDISLLREDAERALHEKVVRAAGARGRHLGRVGGCCTGTVPALERFFDEVLVMAEEPDVRAARLGLLQTVVERAPRASTGGRSTPLSPTDPRDSGVRSAARGAMRMGWRGRLGPHTELWRRHDHRLCPVP